MSTIRKFSIYDLMKFNNVNLDILTETFGTAFYGEYIGRWSDYNVVSQNSVGMIEAYILGKVEGEKGSAEKKNWHSHVSAVTVAPYFRLQGLARLLMAYFEKKSNQTDHVYYADLFVRSSNKVAINMYKKLGYCIYQTVDKYYSADGMQPAEDAYDMRKSLDMDPKHELAYETGKTIQPEDIEFY